MLLDQQYPMEHAFRGPAKILDRFGTLDPATIAAADPEEFATMAATPPAIHRYGRSMAGRVQALAPIVNDTYDGHAERLWTEASSGADLLARVMALPGFGKQKAQIFVALLAKQLDVRPEGWEQAVGDYAQDGYRSVADVDRPRLAAEGARLQEGRQGGGEGCGRAGLIPARRGRVGSVRCLTRGVAE